MSGVLQPSITVSKSSPRILIRASPVTSCMNLVNLWRSLSSHHFRGTKRHLWYYFVFNPTELLNFKNVKKKYVIFILGDCVYVCLGEILNAVVH